VPPFHLLLRLNENPVPCHGIRRTTPYTSPESAPEASPALRTRRFARERWSHFADPVDLRAWQPWGTIQLAQKCNGSSVPLGTNAGAHLDPSADDMFWVAGNRFPPRPNHCHHFYIYIVIYTLWLFNIAMENGPFIDGLPIKMVISHGYVK